MNLGRLWRTARHLGAEQFAYQIERRVRRRAVRALPNIARRRIERQAAALPMPNLDAAPLRAIAETVAKAQGEIPDDLEAGRFTLMNRDFDFGAPDRIDWRGDFGDGGNPLRRLTLSYMGAALPALASGDGLEATADMLAALERDNPWSTPGVFRDVWNPYGASHRLINLLAGLVLHRRAGGPVGTEAENAVLAHVRFCAAFVRANLERDLQFNHLMKNLVALAVYGAGMERLPKSFSFLPEAVRRSVGQCVLADGGHVERSPMYHKLALTDLRLLHHSGLFGETLVETVARMETALAAMCHPDGDIALFNDSWIGDGAPSAALIDTACVGDVATLPDTGYVRLGRGGDVVLFDCGACGPDATPGHAHADFLSIEASVSGRRFIVDPGVPTYTAGPERGFTRSAAAHNGPLIEGIEPLELWGSFRIGRRVRAEAVTDSALDGFAPLWCAGRLDTGLGPTVSRYVGIWPGSGLLICDTWSGAPAGARSRFLVSGDWRLAEKEPPAFSLDGVHVQAETLVGEVEPVASGRHWREFDVERPAHEIAVRPEVRGDRCQAALWWAWGSNAEPPGSEKLESLLGRLADTI
jgi:hypothetical protein